MDTRPLPTECHHCNDGELSWTIAFANPPGVTGMVLASDLEVQALLVCDLCSRGLRSMPIEEAMRHHWGVRTHD